MPDVGFAVYVIPEGSHHKNEVTCYRKHVDKLNLERIVDFPILNLAINVYVYTVSKKIEKVNIFPYHISEQPKSRSLNRHGYAPFIEKGMRGGISMVSKRHAKANNSLTAEYNPDKENNYIMYHDAKTSMDGQ